MQKLRNIATMLLVIVLAFALCSALQAAGAVKTAKSDSSTQSVKSADKEVMPWDYSDSEAAPVKETPVYITALSFIFKLVVVLALVYITILGLKKFSNIKTAVGAGQHCIKVLDQSSLGTNKSLHVIQVGSKRLLVASTPSRINLLTELDEDDVPTVGFNQQNAGFKDHLSTFMGNKTDATNSAATVADMLRESSSFLQDKVREVGKSRRKFRDDDNE